ncbi:MAG: hypothetical protein QOG06_669 [Gaiellaceae bacterium]|jgi:hypothetical protein|nr:hypothetical protein [Gaiellaceae bacterium]
MGRWVIALLAAGVALVAASARAQTEQVLLAPTVVATHDLPSNGITTFPVTCPRGYIAVSAGVLTAGPGTTLLKITPAGMSSYRFRFGNPVTNGDQRVTVAVACRKVNSSKYVFRLKPLRTKYVLLPPRRTGSATLECPPGTAPARAGVDLDPSRQKSLDAYRGGPALSIRSQTSILSRLSFSVLNRGGQPRTVAFYGGCLTLIREAGTSPERLHVKATTTSVPLHHGSQTITRRCPSGWVSFAAGYSLFSRPTTVAGAAAIARGGRWSLQNDRDGDTKADVQLVCGRLAP